MRFGPLVTLQRLQLRVLASNRMACVILAMLPLAAAIAGMARPSQSKPICYVLYWQEDSWVEHLRDALPSMDVGGPRIEVRPVRHFVDSRGVICYPRGAHSIQLRPPDPSRPYWLVWYWYSGCDPHVLDGAVDWFWNVTRSHFGDAAPIHVRVSPLETSVPFLQSLRLSPDALSQQSAKPLVVWVAWFYCACYLPALSLAQQREQRTILSLFVSPVGWKGAATSIWLMYALLSLLAGTLVLLLARLPLESNGLLLAATLGTVAYLGIAFTIGCWCGSVASASAGLGIYVLVSTLALAADHLAAGHAIALLGKSSIESSIIAAASPTIHGHMFPAWIPLACWATFLHGLGWYSFRRHARSCPSG